MGWSPWAAPASKRHLPSGHERPYPGGLLHEASGPLFSLGRRTRPFSECAGGPASRLNTRTYTRTRTHAHTLYIARRFPRGPSKACFTPDGSPEGRPSGWQFSPEPGSRDTCTEATSCVPRDSDFSSPSGLGFRVCDAGVTAGGSAALGLSPSECVTGQGLRPAFLACSQTAADGERTERHPKSRMHATRHGSPAAQPELIIKALHAGAECLPRPHPALGPGPTRARLSPVSPRRLSHRKVPAS